MSLLQLSSRFKSVLRPSVRDFGCSIPYFAGHNKWSKIKEGKGANDSLKSKLYGRANRDIILAARRGGSVDPTLNSGLAAAIAKARSNGVPKANITAALDQAQKNRETGSHQEHAYQALVGGKVGLIIECFSENSARTFREVRETIDSHGAQFASVAYMFQRVGRIVVLLREEQSLEELEDEALEGGAEDIKVLSSEDAGDNTQVQILVPPELLQELTLRLKLQSKFSVRVSSILDVPLDPGPLDDVTRMDARSLIEKLKEHPDVHNIRVSPEV